MLVLPDADLELVADSAINAGFGSAGERCMAISVVVAVEPVADALIEKIVSRMEDSGILITTIAEVFPKADPRRKSCARQS